MWRGLTISSSQLSKYNETYKKLLITGMSFVAPGDPLSNVSPCQFYTPEFFNLASL